MTERNKTVTVAMQVEDDAGTPCMRCGKPSRWGDIFDMRPNEMNGRFACSDCAQRAPRALLYSFSEARFNELSVAPELPALAIKPWTLEHQNFNAAYGSVGVVGIVWRCSVFAPLVVDSDGKPLP
ncbi:MAG TPA: hypothetical protein VNM39_13180 [Verrucomicrobiae bacterium]|nr:hypothetical protein [Verrucomicrobiae bacterium]